ncbi:MAG: anti-sigma factor antagonist [Spirochaetales bacterium]|nr:anti-sigma factor antagonist [Spirochaetales bacterium]
MTETLDSIIDEQESSIEIVFEELDRRRRLALLHLRGFVDIQNYRYLHRQIDRVIERGYVNLIFDFEKLAFLSSTGIGAFADFLKAVKGRGGDLVIYAVQRRVQEVIDLLGFTRFFNKKESLEEAREHFNGARPVEAGAFPRRLRCPVCGTGLRVLRPGRFRCPACRTVFEVRETGRVFVA